jgi:hypothetical protein
VEAPKVEDEEAMFNTTSEEDGMNAPIKGVVDGESEAIDVPMRPEEKKRLNWENGLYLAPLTTVGNLVRTLLQLSSSCIALRNRIHKLTCSPSDVCVSTTERQSPFLKWPSLNLLLQVPRKNGR